MISLAPFSSKTNPIEFKLKINTLDKLNEIPKLVKTLKVEGCDIAEYLNDAPLYLSCKKHIIDTSMEEFEFIVNPMIAVNYCLNKAELIRHVRSRWTNTSSYQSKSVVDFSIISNMIIVNSYSSVKLTGINSDKKQVKCSSYVQINLELAFNISIFHPTNQSVHVDHPDISKYSLSPAYSKSILLEQIQSYSNFKNNPVKRQAPTEPTVKIHNSLPISLPFYLKYYFSLMEQDILKMYKREIDQLYIVSKTNYKHLCQLLQAIIDGNTLITTNDFEIDSKLQCIYQSLNQYQ